MTRRPCLATFIATLRAAGAVPRAFDFEVPRLPPGPYASEIWYKGIQTDWYEIAGRQPRLTIRPEYGGLLGMVGAATALAAAAERLVREAPSAL
jgi:hypothetical protein